MNSKNKFLRNSCGFSMIEVIIIIIVSGVAFSMMFQFFGSSITQSSAPIHRLSHALELKQIAERITAHYEQDTTADGLIALKDNLDSIPPVGYGSNYTVAYNKFIKFIDQKDKEIKTPATTSQKNILKVTITHNNTGEKITMLFMRND